MDLQPLAFLVPDSYVHRQTLFLRSRTPPPTSSANFRWGSIYHIYFWWPGSWGWWLPQRKPVHWHHLGSPPLGNRLEKRRNQRNETACGSIQKNRDALDLYSLPYKITTIKIPASFIQELVVIIGYVRHDLFKIQDIKWPRKDAFYTYSITYMYQLITISIFLFVFVLIIKNLLIQPMSKKL